MKFTAQIFLSYAREDGKAVERIYEALSSAGLRPWMDKKDIVPGEQWELRLQEAIFEADLFLLFLSRHSINKRGFIQKEIKQALDILKGMLASDIYVVPIRLEDCEVPTSLEHLQWLDLFEEEDCAQLLQSVQVALKRRGISVTDSDDKALRSEDENSQTGLLPPQLIVLEEVAGMIEIDGWLGKNAELSITLQNGDRDQKGRAQLQVLHITMDVPWLQATSPVNYPLTIPSGQYYLINFSIVSNSLGEGVHMCKITITDLFCQRDIYVKLVVGIMWEFEGAIAIDFGNTNLRCAASDESGRPCLLEVDTRKHNAHPTTTRSAIVYRDILEGDVRDYEIGNYAYALAEHYEFQSSSVVELDRLLAQSEPVSIRCLNDPSKLISLTPSEIVGDLLRRILERAEDQLRSRITRCTISHPTHFSIRQIENLKSALTECGLKREDIFTIHNAIGAASMTIQRPEVTEQYEKYSMAVCHLDGSSTEISLYEVTNNYDPRRELMSVMPRLLAANGNRWAEGGGTSDLLMQLMLEKCGLILRERFPYAHSTMIPIQSGSFNDPQHRRFATENRLRLREPAERTNDLLCKGGNLSAEEVVAADLYLTVLVDGVVEADQRFRLQDVLPVAEVLDATLRPKMELFAEMTRELAQHNGIEAPDIILLLGESSRLPIVEEVVSKQFPQSKIERPEDPESGAVLGACYLTSREPHAGLEIDVRESRSATTSRIGFRVNVGGRIEFREIVGAGVPIPSTGLKVLLTRLGRLRRHHRISLLENTGLEDDFVVNGLDNRNIRAIIQFEWESKLAIWEAENGWRIPDEALSNSKIELEVSPNLTLRLVARIPGIEGPIEFATAEL